MATRTRRNRWSDRRQLTDRLIMEYGGAVPPGQVLAAVLRADRLLDGYSISASGRQELCEALVRRRLADCAART